MIKYTLAAFAALFMIASFSSCFNVNKVPKMSFEFSEVVEAPGVKQRQLYLRTVEWFNENFESSKSVIQSQDKEDGVFYGKAAFQYPHGGGLHYIFFSVNVSVKDNKYKYVFKDFRHEGVIYDGKRELTVEDGSLNDIYPDKVGSGRLTKRQWSAGYMLSAMLKTLYKGLKTALPKNPFQKIFSFSSFGN